MIKTHWHYFLSLEREVVELSNYIEFHQDNMKTYSTEIAKILMSSTQEIDVLLKQLCNRDGDNSSTENGYRCFVTKEYPKIVSLELQIPKYGLKFIPFAEWSLNKTPFWWTANNKVKHERHNQFSEANLNNLLNSVAALLLTNLFYYKNELNEGVEPTKLFVCNELVDGVGISEFGTLITYTL